MSRPTGLPKTGGRTKGTPNKRSILFQDLLKQNGLDPVQKISELLPQLSPKEQSDVMLQLLPYLYPKRRAVDLGLADQEKGEPKNFIDLVRLTLSDTKPVAS